MYLYHMYLNLDERESKESLLLFGTTTNEGRKSLFYTYIRQV